MPSAVSALSGCVANGHQAVRPVSFSPSKIPYGGFSPVRLQAGRRRQPSPSRAYMPSKPFRFPRTLAREGNRRTVSALRRDIVQAHRPRGPWLGDGLCCPATSTLTMASSEALGPSRRLMALAAGLCLIGRAPEIPQFKPRVFRSVPSPIPRWARWPLAVVVPPVIAFAHY